MDAGMDMYETGIKIVQGFCTAHDLQLRVVNKISILRITHFRPESLAFHNSLTNWSAMAGKACSGIGLSEGVEGEPKRRYLRGIAPHSYEESSN